MTNETYQACVTAIKKRIDHINWTYSKKSSQTERAGLIAIGYVIDALSRRFIKPADWSEHTVSEDTRNTWLVEWYFSYCTANAELCRAVQIAARDKRLILRSPLTRTVLDDKSIGPWLRCDIEALQLESSDGFFPGLLNLNLMTGKWPDAVGKLHAAAYITDIAEWADAERLAPAADVIKLLGGATRRQDFSENGTRDNQVPASQTAPASESVTPDAVLTSPPAVALPVASVDKTLSKLFDPVPIASLEKMFPADGKWKQWAERAARNGLKEVREGRASFNPYRAALWFLKQGETGWDLSRCHRKLAENLPARSRHEASMLTNDLG